MLLDDETKNSVEAAFAAVFAHNESEVDPALSLLFKSPPVVPLELSLQNKVKKQETGRKIAPPTFSQTSPVLSTANRDRLQVEDIGATRSKKPEEFLSDDDSEGGVELVKKSQSAKKNRKRKRQEEEDSFELLESRARRRLAKKIAEESREDGEGSESAAIAESDAESAENGSKPNSDQDIEIDDDDDDGDDDDDDTIIQHESLIKATTKADSYKAERTVFLANVSTEAIISKSGKKTLLAHLSQFLPSLPPPKANATEHKIESIRFRSTPFGTNLPKKAAFAKKEVMIATSHSTNAYAVYSTPLAAKDAVARLNGTVTLDRHLRVDSVAHPAKIDHKRCVFVGNLDFADDDTANRENAEAYKQAEDKKVRKIKNRAPADVEEGLWRQFGKAGTVESVRVVRDQTTRMGKGFAYVQFTNENAVERSLLFNDKKFPPMLPRKLRVTRAKSFKRKAVPSEVRGAGKARALYGKAAAAVATVNAIQEAKAERKAFLSDDKDKKKMKEKKPKEKTSDSDSIKPPESFIFEGIRASSKSGNSGLNLGGKRKNIAKAKSRRTDRSLSWKKMKKL